MSTRPDPLAVGLTVEMVPVPLWGSNLRTLAPEAWRIVRARARAEAESCAYCGEAPEHCHEVWEYAEHDGDEGTARLVHVAMVCEHCHDVVHLGRTGKVHGVAGIDQAKAHLGAVNGWSDEQVEAHVAQAQATWERRSAMRWGLDFGPVVHEYGLSADDLRGIPVAMSAIVREEVAG